MPSPALRHPGQRRTGPGTAATATTTGTAATSTAVVVAVLLVATSACGGRQKREDAREARQERRDDAGPGRQEVAEARNDRKSPGRRTRPLPKSDQQRRLRHDAALLAAQLERPELNAGERRLIVAHLKRHPELSREVRKLLRGDRQGALTAELNAPSPTAPASPTPGTPAAAASPGAAAVAPTITVLIPADELRAANLTAVAVPTFVAPGIDAGTVNVLSDVALGAAAKVNGLSVVGTSDLEAMLSLEKQKDLLGCDDVSCASDIGGALGVDALLAGKIGKVGDTWVVTVSVIEIGKSRAVTRGEARTAAEADALLDLVTALAHDALAPLAP